MNECVFHNRDGWWWAEKCWERALTTNKKTKKTANLIDWLSQMFVSCLAGWLKSRPTSFKWYQPIHSVSSIQSGWNKCHIVTKSICTIVVVTCSEWNRFSSNRTRLTIMFTKPLKTVSLLYTNWIYIYINIHCTSVSIGTIMQIASSSQWSCLLTKWNRFPK